METVIISGTPGTGKSTLAKLLKNKLNFKQLNLKPILEKIHEKYDRKKQCYVINTKKLNKKIIKIIKLLSANEKGLDKSKTSLKQSKQNLIISSHLIHHLPKKYVDLCIITKCPNLKTLKQRLKKRKYSKKKIKENLECEIFDICLNEAKQNKHKILIIDTSKRINQKELIKKIKQIIKI